MEVIMKKMVVALIGQGRSGRDIHGIYFLSKLNEYYEVKYVVEQDEDRRKASLVRYENCQAVSNYQELLNKDDVDLFVNASYSDQHYSITKDLLEHGKNVLVEKPFAETEAQCDELINIAKQKGVLLAVFQNTQLAPYYLHAKEIIKSGIIGEPKQISIRFNAFARRWDWQTLQKRVGGSAYNTGPHPFAMALGFLDFDENVKIEFSKLDCVLTSGDADDYDKIILTAPNKPVVDIEINSIDFFSDYNIKIQASKGTLKSNPLAYKYKYIVVGENVERPVIEESLKNDEGNPIYCSEKLITHEEDGKYDGTAFDVGTAGIYKDIYFALTEGKPLTVVPEQSKMVIKVIENMHKNSPLPRKF